MNFLKTIAFTHKQTPITELSRFFVPEENRKDRLEFMKASCGIRELLYVPTCNRIEFVFTTDHSLDKQYLSDFFHSFSGNWTKEEVDFAIQHGETYEGDEALRHIFRVASSLDSLVIGEREIITQVRKSYESCHSAGLTGDDLRLVVKNTITAAKQVYTDTKIANNPVSVVSLAERKLRSFHLNKQSRIVMVGAGETNTNLAKYMVKQGFTNFAIFNRSVENGAKLAAMISSATVKAVAYPLSDLSTYSEGMDVLVTCTGSSEKLVTVDVYKQLLAGDGTKKVIIDLSVPSNIDEQVIAQFPVSLIDINELREIADRNLSERQSEFEAAECIVEENVQAFRHLYRTRSMELKLKEVPGKIREIKDRAVNDVFAHEINGLDEHSKAVLAKVLDYMEKKCISVPMVMAKEIILESGN